MSTMDMRERAAQVSAIAIGGYLVHGALYLGSVGYNNLTGIVIANVGLVLVVGYVVFKAYKAGVLADDWNS